jgi:hypothetical protein
LPAATRPARNDDALADVLRHPGIWRRGSKPASSSTALSTGFAELDAMLPGGGWPRGALSEILIDEDGLGECSLVLPALAALTQARRRVALIAPPYVPYAPAMVEAGIDLAQLVHIDAGAADTHWTAEQCLRARGEYFITLRIDVALVVERLHAFDAIAENVYFDVASFAHGILRGQGAGILRSDGVVPVNAVLRIG